MVYIWWKRGGDSCDADRFENRSQNSSGTYHDSYIAAIIQAYAGDTSTAVYGLVDFCSGTKSNATNEFLPDVPLPIMCATKNMRKRMSRLQAIMVQLQKHVFRGSGIYI